MIRETTLSTWALPFAVFWQFGMVFLLVILGMFGIVVPASASILLSEAGFLIPVIACGYKRPGALFLKKAGIYDLVFAALIGIALIPPATALSALTQDTYGNAVSESLEAFSGVPPVLCLFYFGVLAPAAEELFFRGLLCKTYDRAGSAQCIFLTALLFGLFHMNLNQFSYAFCLGIVFAWMTLSYKSVLPAVAAHAAFNSIETLVLFIPEMEAHLPYLCTGALFVLAACGIMKKTKIVFSWKEKEEEVTVISPALTVSGAALVLMTAFVTVMQILA